MSGLSRKEFKPILDKFISDTSSEMGIKNIPEVKIIKDDQINGDQPSFAYYNPNTKEIGVRTKDRHPIDIFRSVAHELRHHYQNENGMLGTDITKEGSTGSNIENDANATAGITMRNFAKRTPQAFNLPHLTENIAFFVIGGPNSGKDRIINEHFSTHKDNEISVDNFNAYITEHKQNRSYYKIKNILSKNLGIIISGNAQDFDSIKNINTFLKENEYNTNMIFVAVDDNTSRQRNDDRNKTGARQLTEETRQQKWNISNMNKEKFKKLFHNDNKFIEIDNSFTNDDSHKSYKQIKKILNEATEANDKTKVESKEKPVDIPPTASELEQAKRLGVIYMKFGAWGKVSKGKTIITHITRNGQLIQQKPTIVSEDSSPYDREWGTTELANNYKNSTPGQESTVVEIVNKVRNNTANNSLTSTPTDSIGPTFGVSGVGGTGIGYSLPQTGINESVMKWAQKKETIQKFNKKYGIDGPKKLKETVIVLSENHINSRLFNIMNTVNAVNSNHKIQKQ